MHTDRLQNAHAHTPNSALCLLLSHTNCQIPLEMLYVQKVCFPRTECDTLSTTIKYLPKKQKSRYKIHRGIPMTKSRNDTQTQIEHTSNGWQTQQTPTSPLPWSLLTLTPHFHFYGLLPSARRLLQHCDTQ